METYPRLGVESYPPPTLFPKEDPEALPLTPKGGSSVDESSEKRKGSRKIKSPPATLSDVTIPQALDTPAARQALEIWMAYKRECGKPYKTIGLQALVKLWAPVGESRLIAAVNHSMSNGWAGLYEPTVSGHSARTATSHAAQNYDPTAIERNPNRGKW